MIHTRRTVTRTTPPPTDEQFGKAIKPHLLRLHQMSADELMTMVERLAARRAQFQAQIAERNADVLRARREAIEEALRDPFMDKQTAFTLLDELAEISTKMSEDGL